MKTMKKLFTLMVCLAAFSVAVAQTETKTFKLADFTAITLNSIPDVECVKDASQAGKIVVTATNIPMKLIEVKCEDGNLKIGVKKNSDLSLFKNRSIKVTAFFARYIDNACVNGSGSITTNVFSNQSGSVSLLINGSGDIKANNLLAGKAIISVNGSGDIDIKNALNAKDANISVNGSGEIEINSAKVANSVNASVNGSGDIDIKSCDTNTLSASVNGSGELDIERAKAGTVSAGVAGSGDLEISGTTTSASYSATGSGDVKCGKLKANIVSMNATGSGDIYYNSAAQVTNTSGKSKNMHAVN